MSESHVTWANSVLILVFPCLSVLDFVPMYAATDRRQTSDAHRRLMPPYPRGRGIRNKRASNQTNGNRYITFSDVQLESVYRYAVEQCCAFTARRYA